MLSGQSSLVYVNILPKCKHCPKRKVFIRNKADHLNIQKSPGDFTHEYFSLNQNVINSQRQMEPYFHKNHQHYEPIYTAPSHYFQIQPSLVQQRLGKYVKRKQNDIEIQKKGKSVVTSEKKYINTYFVLQDCPT